MTPLAKQVSVGLRLVLAILLISGFATAQAKQKSAAPAKAETITFVEITSKLGIAVPPLSHAPEAADLRPIPSSEFSLDYAREHLIPAMGGSIAVDAPDSDGRRSLYVAVPGGANHLLRQSANGSFADITEKAKVSGTGCDLAAAFGDFDHSGRSSLFVAGLGGVRLYRNEGGSVFTDVTEKAGLKGKSAELATSVLLFDADGDGFLDVLVTIYTDLSAPPAKTSFVFPNDFSGVNSRLYRNQHDGTFRDITEDAGLDSNPGRTRKAIAADFNHSGRMDLLLLRDNKPPVLYKNAGQGKFEDVTWDVGKEIWRYAYLDAQTGDFNHDGRVDVALWSTVGNEVLWNTGEGKFEDDEEVLPLVYAANRPFGFHGTVVNLGAGGYDSLLGQDAKENWRLIVNNRGHFAEAHIALLTEKNSSETKDSRASATPVFAWLRAIQLGRSGNCQLLTLTMDGRVMVFEKLAGEMKADPAKKTVAIQRAVPRWAKYCSTL
ncbi:MAG: VCBS repeat-containing protein [Candidatus Sulfotelmatobacter sp.]